MEIDLSLYKALVGGCTSGIGKAIADKLVCCGAELILLSKDEEKLKKQADVYNTISQKKHSYLVADFQKPEMLAKALDIFFEAHPNAFPDMVVNNTGGPNPGLITEAKPEELTTTFDMHVVCNHIIMQKVLPAMKEKKYGRFLNIISTSVKEPLNNLGVSNTIRNAVANWAKTLANELAPWQITVNNLLPGMTETERLKSLLNKTAQSKNISYQEAEEMFIKDIPMNRFASADEIAQVAIFLISPWASYMTGINVPVDGGRTKSL